MIFVKVEVWPGGDSLHAVTIAGATIANVSGLADVSDYACVVRAEGHDELGIPLSTGSVLIKGHERKAGVLELLRRVFAAACKRPGDLSDFGPHGYSMILTEDIDALRVERDAALTQLDALRAENKRLQDQLHTLTLGTGKKFADLMERARDAEQQAADSQHAVQIYCDDYNKAMAERDAAIVAKEKAEAFGVRAERATLILADEFEMDGDTILRLKAERDAAIAAKEKAEAEYVVMMQRAGQE